MQQNWNISTRPIRGSQIYVAFPGMGKTTYARQHAGVVDLDFGSFRSALGVAPKMQATLFGPFVKFANTYTKGGFTVLTNEPGLIPYLKQDGYKVIVSLPKDISDLVDRVLKRHLNPTFDKMLAENAESWMNDWARTAKRYGAEITYSRYFNILKEVEKHENREN